MWKKSQEAHNDGEIPNRSLTITMPAESPAGWVAVDGLVICFQFVFSCSRYSTHLGLGHGRLRQRVGVYRDGADPNVTHRPMFLLVLYRQLFHVFQRIKAINHTKEEREGKTRLREEREALFTPKKKEQKKVRLSEEREALFTLRKRENIKT